MKTSLEKGIELLKEKYPIEFTDEKDVDRFWIRVGDTKKAIETALQDFADKVEKWLINTEFDFEEHILTYEFPKLKKNEGLK